MQAPRARWTLAAVAAIWLLVGGNLTRIGLNAHATVLMTLGAALLLPCTFGRPSEPQRGVEPLNPHRGSVPLPLWLFTGYAVASALVVRTSTGFQNAMVYFIFTAVLALAATFASAGSPMLLLRWMRWAAVAGCGAFLASVAVFGPGNGVVYQPRDVGLLAWISMVAAIPLANRSRRGLVVPAMILATAILSLSRTSIAVCLLLLSALALNSRSRGQARRTLTWLTIAAAAGYIAVTRYGPLQQRFLANDMETYGGVTIGTSGRSKMWQVTWDSIQLEPVVGHGVGSASRLISKVFGYGFLDHPHNDYLRLWHDFGIIGLALWMLGMWVLGIGAWRRWRTATSESDRAIHLAAVLAVVGLAASIVTSNMIVYVYVAVPVAAIIGTSLGRANAIRGQAERVRAPHNAAAAP
jgi:O-antigen ligase